MKTRRNLLLVVSIIFAGLIGGALSNVLFMTGTSVAQVGKQPEKLVSAQEFRLVDVSGKTRATLIAGAHGGVSMDFYDVENKSRVAISLSSKGTPSLKLSGGAAIELRDKNDKVRSKIVMLSDGNPSVRLYDDKGGIRAILGGVNLETLGTSRIESLGKRDESSLVLVDEEGEILWATP